MNRILAAPLSGEEIERRSFERIDAEGVRPGYSNEEWILVRRLIHTCGDPSLGRCVRFRGNWAESGVQALRSRARIYCDSSMIASGISLARLREVNPSYTRDHIVVRVADPAVAELAAAEGLPRSLFAVRSCASWLEGSIALFGNAPVGLAELMRIHMEDGIRPAWTGAMPVGFVHVMESKEEFLRSDLDGVAVAGLRGGSPLAVASLHALCSIAKEMHP
ncbi:MAG TPA: precorrin-8X methylmutase [Fibrobacteria bacterium]|nr:precorrin-8X methylmutase [Fibrobacteria bacterium]HOX51103.1 precorrin-8X methylmutase [Fibrobacteria bacterium]